MRSLTLILCAALFTALPASAEVPAYIQVAPGAAQYPDDDGLLLRQTVRLSLRADGTVEKHVEESWKMLTANLTRNEVYDPRVDYDEARADLRIDQARTYMVDGAIVDAKANSFVPNTASELQWAVPYANIRQMVVAHVGVEHGATSVLAYTIADRAPSGVPFWGDLELQSYVPILEQWVTLEVPEGTALAFAGVHCELTPEVTTEGGVTSYTFHRTDVPSVNVSEFGHGPSNLDRLVFAAVDDWAAARTFLEQQVEPAMVPGPAVQAKTDEIVDGLSLEVEKMAEIHAFVLEGVRDVHWPIAAFGHQVRPAGDVLDSSVGHALDKAVLLGAMLRAAGLDAHVALVGSSPTIAADVPAPGQLDQAWVRVNLGHKTKWLDPTASVDRHNNNHLAGLSVLVLDGAATGPIVQPALDAAHNRAALRVQVDIDAADHALELSGEAAIDLSALYNPLVAYDRSAARQKGVARKVAGAFGGAGVDEVVVARQLCKFTSLGATFSGGSLEVPEHGLVAVELPRVPGAVTGASLDTHRNARTQPVHVDPATERVEVALDLPDGYEVAFAPANAAFANDVGSFRRTVEAADGELTITTLLLIEASEVAPAHWSDLRALVDAVEGDAANKVLLRRVQD